MHVVRAALYLFQMLLSDNNTRTTTIMKPRGIIISDSTIPCKQGSGAGIGYGHHNYQNQFPTDLHQTAEDFGI